MYEEKTRDSWTVFSGSVALLDQKKEKVGAALNRAAKKMALTSVRAAFPFA
jgi:hypothetical protein